MDDEEIISKISKVGVMNNSNIWEIAQIEKTDIDIEKELKEVGYKQITYDEITTDLGENTINFGNIVKTTKKEFDTMMKAILILGDGKTNIKKYYDVFGYWIKKDKPIFIFYLGYVGVIAPRIEE